MHHKDDTMITVLHYMTLWWLSYITWNIVAAFRGMHVSPAKHSYAWLPRKCDYRTDGQTDTGQSDPYVPLCFAGDTKVTCVQWFHAFSCTFRIAVKHESKGKDSRGNDRGETQNSWNFYDILYVMTLQNEDKHFWMSCSPLRWHRESELNCGSGDHSLIPGVPSLHAGPLIARRLKMFWISRSLCLGTIGTLNTLSCPWNRWVLGNRSKFGNWTPVTSHHWMWHLTTKQKKKKKKSKTAANKPLGSEPLILCHSASCSVYLLNVNTLIG